MEDLVEWFDDALSEYAAERSALERTIWTLDEAARGVVAEGGAKGAKVSSLCTVIFHANLAHNLTRSP